MIGTRPIRGMEQIYLVVGQGECLISNQMDRPNPGMEKSTFRP
jgi:hypothetical protein